MNRWLIARVARGPRVALLLASSIASISLSIGCSESRPAPSSAGATSTGGDVPTATPRTPHDAGSNEDADAGEVPCGPPFTCDAGADSSSPVPGPKPGGGGSGTPGSAPSCGSVTFGTGSMLATGPTTSFQNAYSAALAAQDTGGFAIVIDDVEPGSSDVQLSVAGAARIASAAAKMTETPATSKGSMSSKGALTLTRVTSPFHLAFTRSVDPNGDIEVTAVDVNVPSLPSCTSASATVVLYIKDTEGSALLNGTPLSTLLGAPSVDVGGTGFTGWAVPLSGTLAEVSLR